MRLMMRNRQRRNSPFAGQAQGKMGGGKIGMQIVGDAVRPDLENIQQMANRFLEKADGCRIVESADVLRQKRFAALHDANGVLQITAKRQHRRPVTGERDRHRHVAAGTPDEGGTVRRGAHHRVIAASHDLAVMRQVGIGNSSQARQRLVVADDQRLAVRIGAGHDQQQIGRLGPATPCRPDDRRPRARAADEWGSSAT